MAGKVPFFITGASALLKINTLTLAFCTDVTYTVRVKHASPHILGVFEAFTQEPLTYEVVGSFSVVRYTKGLKKYLEGIDKNGTPDSVSNRGNGVGSWGPVKGIDTLTASVGGNSFGGMSRADQSFDPSKLGSPVGFDIEIQQKTVNGETGILARLRGCRLTSSDFKLMKRGLAIQTFTFQACYADEDSFNAGASGLGQTII